MIRRVCVSFAILLCLASIASATITVTVGSATVPVGTPSATIQVTIGTDAGDQMGGEQFIFSTGPYSAGAYPTVSAPTAFGPGANSAQILSYDLSTGTVWGGNDLGASPASPPPAGTRKISASDASKTSGATVPAQGLLATVTIDTSNLPAGDYELRANKMSGGSSQTKITDASGVAFTIQFAGEGGLNTPGFLHITPEPSTMVLGLFAAAGLVAAAARKRRART